MLYNVRHILKQFDCILLHEQFFLLYINFFLFVTIKRIRSQKSLSQPELSSGGGPSTSAGQSSKFVLSVTFLMAGVMGGGRIRPVSPSQQKPSNHLGDKGKHTHTHTLIGLPYIHLLFIDSFFHFVSFVGFVTLRKNEIIWPISRITEPGIGNFIYTHLCFFISIVPPL